MCSPQCFLVWIKRLKCLPLSFLLQGDPLNKGGLGVEQEEQGARATSHNKQFHIMSPTENPSRLQLLHATFSLLLCTYSVSHTLTYGNWKQKKQRDNKSHFSFTKHFETVRWKAKSERSGIMIWKQPNGGGIHQVVFACCENTGLLASREPYIWVRARECTLDLFCRDLTYVHVFLGFYQSPMCINVFHWYRHAYLLTNANPHKTKIEVK